MPNNTEPCAISSTVEYKPPGIRESALNNIAYNAQETARNYKLIEFCNKYPEAVSYLDANGLTIRVNY